MAGGVAQLKKVHGVNRRSENFLLLSDLLFARGRYTRSRYKRVEFSRCFELCIQFQENLIASFVVFFTSYSQDNAFSLLHVRVRKKDK